MSNATQAVEMYRCPTLEGAVDRLEDLYQKATVGLEYEPDRYLDVGKLPSAEERAMFCYPFLRLSYYDAAEPRTN